jgi:hypothetical protein
MSLQEFKSNLLGGGARPNQYRAEITFPAIAQNGTEAGRRIQFLCASTTLPSSDLGVIPVFYRGRQVPLAGERTFAPWAVTILNDTDFVIRNAFESWQNAINDLQFNTGMTSPLIYTSDMSIHQMGRNGETLKSYKFVGAFPTEVSSIPLSFASNDQVEEFNVQFVYTHFETDFKGGSVGLAVNI